MVTCVLPIISICPPDFDAKIVRWIDLTEEMGIIFNLKKLPKHFIPEKSV